MDLMTRNAGRVAGAALLSLLALNGCGGGGGDEGGALPVVTTSSYVVLAWNNLGMHCLNPSYDTAVILPPYNTLWAQVIRRGNKPAVVTDNIRVEYRIVNNTASAGKGSFGQFWETAVTLFKGLFPAMADPLPLNQGLTGNGLSGRMTLVNNDHFEVSGIPVVPIDDSGTRNPYQVAEITVRDSSGTTVLAQTRCTVPTSDEINCAKCHAPGGTVTDTFNDILRKHDTAHRTDLMNSKPVLCASCHGSPALGQNSPGSSGKYLSYAIHNSHRNRGPACYDCHPGAATRCNRSTKHTAADGNCTACHGTMANVAATINAGRIPWVSEPKCVTCHSSGANRGAIPEVDTGAVLYRDARGHGRIYCAGCHGSPHAMVPSTQASDNYQALQYQGVAKTLGSCVASCHGHGSSRGAGAGEFLEQHGNGSSRCGICHTGFTAPATTNWPHGYNWNGTN